MGFQCAGMTKRGHRCTKFVTTEGELCFFHDPSRRELVYAARSKGGRLNYREQRKASPDRLPNNGHPPQTAADAMLWSSWLVSAAASGTVGTAVANQTASALRVFLQSLDKAELEGQVAELRAKLQELQRREAAR